MKHIKTLSTRDLKKTVKKAVAVNARHLASQLAKHPAQLVIRVANRLNNTMFHKQRLRSLLFHGAVFGLRPFS